MAFFFLNTDPPPSPARKGIFAVSVASRRGLSEIQRETWCFFWLGHRSLCSARWLSASERSGDPSVRAVIMARKAGRLDKGVVRMSVDKSTEEALYAQPQISFCPIQLAHPNLLLPHPRAVVK